MKLHHVNPRLDGAAWLVRFLAAGGISGMSSSPRARADVAGNDQGSPTPDAPGRLRIA
jgi:hypothetical protein